ncbi:Methyltransferase domain-containing protein [Rhodoblastus acidophilus]|uniref:Methyltransferase domain-containing protein n=1 Tax=Rhodoblastus acidophilus TaxID=1074 RepID=A0A212S3P4_RHOAC|nr:methyltransferase domain-containing protein [Rhodoblastus acidophilus]SNB79638.1 Methyltransferase domain-containing protein [Rhodoblastus acidophilus]
MTADNKAAWASGIADELAFWTHWLATRGGAWPDDFALRCDPAAPLQDEIARFLPQPAPSPLALLDVGAGPMTYVGKTFGGAPIALTAVDALGDAYARLDFPPGSPLVRTQTCDSEALSSLFAQDCFDVAFSRNALDHGYDPIKAIVEMIAVVKPDGLVITVNWPDEALRENWRGFHQWNFRVERDLFVIADRTRRFVVNDAVRDLADIVYLSGEDSGVVHCVMKKRAR